MATRVLLAAALLFMSASPLVACGKPDPAKICAEMAKKCIPKAMDESVEELTGECARGIANKKGWATKSAECAEKHGDDCAAYQACAK